MLYLALVVSQLEIFLGFGDIFALSECPQAALWPQKAVRILESFGLFYFIINKINDNIDIFAL